jgi:Zn-dependent protease with chaperone function
MSVLGALQLVLLAALLFAVVAGVAASLGLPLVLRATQGVEPGARHRALVRLAVLPPLLAIAGVLSTLAPSLLGLVWPDFDHCLAHGGSHAHLCLVHCPPDVGNAVCWAVLLVASATLAGRGAKGTLGLLRARRLGAELLAHASRDPRLAAEVVPSEVPFCLSVGVFKPATLLSRGFLGSVDARELEAVLRHEQAHADRRDTLVRLISEVATVFMLPGARARLLAELEISAEQSCDDLAARAIGDRLTMAEIILKVERLLGRAPSDLLPLAASFGGTAVPLRVRALLEPAREDAPGAIPSVVLLLSLLVVFAATQPLHHATETVLGTLTH